ncbi:MAG: RNA-binding S4 domain-containing protein [Brevirhabdus sp.]
MTDTPTKTRLDKWLWHARFFKTRSLATKQVSGGHVRVNGDKVHKPSASIVPGDTLTFTAGRRVRIIRVLAPSTRRGPAPEAQALYDDLTPPEPPREIAPARDRGFDGKGRPTKKDRRAMDLSRRDHLD